MSIPNVEFMVDFLKIKYISIYVDRLMELKRYQDFKQGLVLKKEMAKKANARKQSGNDFLIDPQLDLSPRSSADSDDSSHDPKL